MCGAKSKPEEGDCYIDDRLHYHLSTHGAIMPDQNENENGRWEWVKHPAHWESKK